MTMQLICFYFVLLFLSIAANDFDNWCTETKVRPGHILVNCNHTIPALKFLSPKTIDFLIVTNLSHNIDRKTFEGVQISRLLIDRGDQIEISEDSFMGLKRLKDLSLISLGLSTLPTNIFNKLINLELLNLRGNYLKDLPEGLLDKQIKLHYLDLSYNSITKISETIFQNLYELKLLNLAGNKNLKIERNAFAKMKNVQVHVNKISCVNLANPNVCMSQMKKSQPYRRDQYNKPQNNQYEDESYDTITFQQYNDSYYMSTTTESGEKPSNTMKSVHNQLNITINTENSTGWTIRWYPDTREEDKWQVCWYPENDPMAIMCAKVTNTSYTIPTESTTAKQTYRICVSSNLQAVCNDTTDCHCVVKSYESQSDSNALIIGLSIGLGLLFLIAIIFIILACMFRTKKPKNRYNVEVAENTSVTQNYTQQVQEIK